MPETALLKPDSIRLAPIVAPLAITQIIGWGTTFWLPALLAPPLSTQLGIASEAIFGGVTVMLVAGAAVAPRLGRVIDRGGSRWPMVAGSLAFFLALAAIALSQGTWTYLAGWVLMGVGMPLALTQAAAAAMAQIAGPKARQAIGLLMLLGGMSSAIFWPFGAWLEASFGWRAMCWVFALLNLLVCVPIHAVFVRRREHDETARAAPLPDEPAALSADEKRTAFVLMAAAFSLTGFISWGLPLQMVEILKAFGHPAGFAVFVGSLMGPAQAAARFAEMAFGKSLGILSVGVIASVLLPVAVALPLLGASEPAVMVAFVAGYGMSAGVMSVVRNVAPLALFGKATYATMIGWLSLPQNIAFAISPMAFAFAMRHGGPAATLAVAFCVALAALGTMLMLERRFRRHARV